jgi:hypothetical protein
VGQRAGLNDVEKRKFLPLLGLELRPLGRPGRSQSLYRLRYPGTRVLGGGGEYKYFSRPKYQTVAASTLR